MKDLNGKGKGVRPSILRFSGPVFNHSSSRHLASFIASELKVFGFQHHGSDALTGCGGRGRMRGPWPVNLALKLKVVCIM